MNRRYTIRRATTIPPLLADITATPWAAAEMLSIDLFPWHVSGDKQATSVAVLYDAAALYLLFLCQDKHISAEPRLLNGAVCKDSCVEAFMAPHPQRRPDYFNLEVNCVGQVHLGLGPGRDPRPVMPERLIRRLGIATPYLGVSKKESPSDNGWWMAARLPFEELSEFLGEPVAPKPGDLWKGNFYRCGGKTQPQHAVWNLIETPAPDFHRPEFFGELLFA